jgi:hypothetical protein
MTLKEIQAHLAKPEGRCFVITDSYQIGIGEIRETDGVWFGRVLNYQSGNMPYLTPKADGLWFRIPDDASIELF